MDRYTLVLSQMRGIKDSKRITLRDAVAVQALALKFGFTDLADLIDLNRKAYLHIVDKISCRQIDLSIIPSAWTPELEEQFGLGRSGYRK